MEQLSVKAFAQKVRSKADLYEALVRNGYYLPKLKSSMVSEHYLVNVMDKTYWCPRAEDIRVRMCPRQPHKDVLIEKFRKLMRDNDLKHGMQAEKLPDKDWLIAVIATLNPEDEIFKKDYLPPARKNAIEEQKTIRVPNGFFEGLPDSKSKVKRKALHIIGEGRAQQKIKYLKAMQAELNGQLALEQMRAEKAREWLKDPATIKPPSRSSHGNEQSPAKRGGSTTGTSSKRQEALLAGSGTGGGKQGSAGSKSLNQSFGQSQPQVQQMMQGIEDFK